jgi:hypothetical protein
MAASACAVTAAWWLLPASIHIVDWPAAGPARVALLPADGLLVWLTAGAAAVALATVVAASPRGWLPSLMAVVTPFALFWLWAVPYMPWLSDRWPLLLLFAGPLRWVVALAVAALLVARFPIRLPSLNRLDARAAFLLSAAIYASLGLHAAATIDPSGDEPHYLVIAHSLLVDGDLAIGNNHERGDYRAFYGGDLAPHFLRRGQDGEIYSIHAPGLSVLLLPAYAAAGYPGAVVFMALMAAVAAWSVFALVETIASRSVAWAVWAATSLAVPVVPHAWLLFPEIPAAAIVALGLLWLWQSPSKSAAVWAARGIVLGLLPWLHTKYIVLLGVFGFAAAVRLRRQPAALVALGSTVALLLAAWLYYFLAIYGVLDPQAPYGSSVDVQLSLAYVPRGVLGLLFDPRLGVLWFAPAYLAAAPGAWMLVRRADTRAMGLWLIAIVLVFLVSTTRFYMWWGGASPPARFLVPIVPCFAVMVAAMVREWNGALARGLLGAAVAAGLCVTLAGSLWPESRYFFSDARGVSRLLALVQGPSALAAAPPGFSGETWTQPALALGRWAIALLVAVSVAAWAARKGSALHSAAAGTVSALLAMALVAAPATADARAESVHRGRQNLVHASDGAVLETLDYRARVRLPVDDVLAVYPVTVLWQPGATVSLPPGTYEARLWFEDSTDRRGEIAVVTGRVEFGRASGALGNPVAVPFELPTTVERLAVSVTDPALARSVRRVEMIPMAVVPRHAREATSVRAIDPIGGAPGALIAYLDDAAYPEGGAFWTRGTAKARVLVAPGGASRVVFTVHLGPRQGEARLTVAGREYRVTIPAGEPQVLDVPVTPGTRVVPVAVQSATSFRPVDEDPTSTDRRRLGCFVEVALR